MFSVGMIVQEIITMQGPINEETICSLSVNISLEVKKYL